MAQPAPRYPQLGFMPRNLTLCQPPAQQVPAPIPPVLMPVPVAPLYNPNQIPFYNLPPQPPVPAEHNLPYGIDRLPSMLPASSLSLIPVLSESKDWTGWNNGVINAVRVTGAMGHLYDTPTSFCLSQSYTDAIWFPVVLVASCVIAPETLFCFVNERSYGSSDNPHISLRVCKSVWNSSTR